MVWRPGHGAALLLRGSQLYGLPRSSPVEPWLTHGLQGDGSVGHVTRGLRSLLSLACDAREAWGGRAPSVLLIAARRVAALWVCGWVLLVARVISYILFITETGAADLQSAQLALEDPIDEDRR